MDIRKIKKLIELVEESGINELEISEGEESVRISRGGMVTQSAPIAHAAPVAIAPETDAASKRTAKRPRRPFPVDVPETTTTDAPVFSAAAAITLAKTCESKLLRLSSATLSTFEQPY